MIRRWPYFYTPALALASLLQPWQTKETSQVLLQHGEVFDAYSSQFHDLRNPQDINLSELQKTLDAQGIEVVDTQKTSLIGRKELAEKTKGPAYDTGTGTELQSTM